MKRPAPDGSQVLVLSGVELLRRLAALLPAPDFHLTRFHGVFAPNARLRPLVVRRREREQQAEDRSDGVGALATRNALVIAVVVLADLLVYLNRIRAEERLLLQSVGEAYREYCCPGSGDPGRDRRGRVLGLLMDRCPAELIHPFASSVKRPPSSTEVGERSGRDGLGATGSPLRAFAHRGTGSIR